MSEREDEIAAPASAPATDPESHLDTTLSAVQPRLLTKEVWAWGLWDWASAAFNAVVTTFVFSTYIADADLFGDNANTYLGYTLAVAGILVALVAPALGQWIDRSGRRATFLRISTIATAFITACLYFVSPGESRLWLGLFLLAAGNIAFETGSVVYNAILVDIAAPGNVGKISGFGWGLGYVGGIVLLLILFVGFIQPDVGWFGVTSQDGLNVRASMLVAALWTLVFSAPLLVNLKNKPATQTGQAGGIIGAYREVFRSIARLWRSDRSVVWFLLSSAIYRDGLSGVFAFGAVLAREAFGFSAGEVIIFGVAANLVAGIATIAFGYVDDRIGARKVILFSVSSMVVLGMLIFIFHDGVAGFSPKQVYWVLGLMLCVFVGPTQSASRTYLARIAPPGEAAEVFGLYATTGRAVSFLSPFMYSTLITIGAAALSISKQSAAYFGILGIVIVLVAGLIAFLPVKAKEKM